MWGCNCREGSTSTGCGAGAMLEAAGTFRYGIEGIEISGHVQ